MDIKNKPKDRQSRTGVNGSPKKGGGGGKGTWGVGGLDDLKTVSVAGSSDPNYDSEEENSDVVFAATDVSRTFSPIESLVQEFLSSGDIEETIKSFKEIVVGDKQVQFVKEAITSAMDKQSYERELVSKLLSAVLNVAVTTEDLAAGFQLCLDSLEDIVIDIPDAVELLGKFLARAIIDEAVAPAFLKYAQSNSPKAEQCIYLANGLLNQPFRSEKLAEVWGPGATNSIKRIKEETNLILEEYLSTSDVNEAFRSIKELNARHFHPHIVQQALELALARDDASRKKLLDLLAHLVKFVLLSEEFVKQGFALCIQSLEDLKLDSPQAPSIIAQFIQTAKNDGWLEQSFEELKIQ